MKKIILPILFILFFNIGYGEEFQFESTTGVEKIFMDNIPQNRGNAIDESQYMFLYNSFGLGDKLNYRIFKMAL